MTLEELKTMSKNELYKLVDIFDDKSITDAQFKEIIGADDYHAKAVYINSQKTPKRKKRWACQRAEIAAMTNAMSYDYSNVSFVSDFF